MKRLLFLALPVFIFSCAANSPTSSVSKFSPVYVTNSSNYELLPTTYIEEKIDSLQKMTASFKTGKNQSEFSADVFFLADNTHISMTILSDLGTTSASLVYDGSSIEFDSALLPKNLRPEYVIADFQQAFYDAQKLRSELLKIGIEFEASFKNNSDGGFTETRILSQKERKISKITKTYSKGKSGGKILKSVRYENFLRGYEYSLIGAER